MDTGKNNEIEPSESSDNKVATPRSSASSEPPATDDQAPGQTPAQSHSPDGEHLDSPQPTSPEEQPVGSPPPPSPPGPYEGLGASTPHSGDSPTDSPPPPPPPRPPVDESFVAPPLPPRRSRPLRRSTTDTMIGGVCSGLGRYFGVDPVVFRVAFVVGIFAGGLGLLLYLAMWLLIPDDTDPYPNPLTNSVWRLVSGVLIVMGSVAALLGWLHSLGGFGGVIVGGSIVGLGLWLYSRDKGGFAAPRSPTPVTPPATGFAYGGTGEPAADYQAYDPATGTYPTTEQSASYAYDGSVATIYPTERLAAGYTYYDPATGTYLTTEPKPRRQHSYLGLITLLGMIVVAGLLGVAQVAGLVSLSAVVFLSILLAVIAVGLIVGAFVGRARWLIAPGLVLALTIATVAPVAPFISSTVDAGFGERTWQPMTADIDYELGIGDATLDLTEWATNPNVADPQVPDDISAEVGVGQLTVLVPETWAVVVDAEVRFGEVAVNGLAVSDTEIDIEYGGILPAQGEAAGKIGLDLTVGAGQIAISQVAVPRVPKQSDQDGNEDHSRTRSEPNQKENQS